MIKTAVLLALLGPFFLLIPAIRIPAKIVARTKRDTHLQGFHND